MKAPKYVNANFCDVVERERSYQRHLEKLTSIKRTKKSVNSERMSMLDSFKNNRVNTQKFFKNEREDVIQRDNHLLLGRIVQISTRDNAKGSIAVMQEKVKVSPNKSKKNYLKKVEEDRIRNENLLLAKRLIEVDEHSNKELDLHLEAYQRAGRAMRKLHHTQDRKVIVKSVETNRKMITKMRLPPIIDRNRSCNQSCIDEEIAESPNKITEKDEERKTMETRRSQTFTLGESDKLNTVK